MRKKILLFISIAIFTMLILFGIEHFSSLNKKTQEISSSETQPTENTKDTELVIDIPKKEDITINMSVIGDIMCHNSQYQDAFNGSTYDFSYVFSDIKDYISNADIAIGNLETTFAGSERGYSNYPTFNTPEQLAYNLKDFGIDVVSTANNHCMDTGYKGLVSTLNYLDDAGISHTGTSRSSEEQNTVLIKDVNGIKIGGGHFQVIAGPCSVESKEQMEEVASDVKASGATLLRGGAFKPRTSPYSFQGLHENGLALLLNAGKTTNLPVVTEIMDSSHIDLFKDVDVIQVGARNMQNFELLKKLGKLDKPILLKRGLANTLEELLMSAEYIMAGGNEKVILCERGIRTFETSMRNTLDISAVPMLKKMTHLPVIIDPSHAAGMRWMVEPLSMAAIAAGADGLMIEVHNNPEKALCDGKQSLTPESFDNLMGKIKKTVEFFGKTLG